LELIDEWLKINEKWQSFSSTRLKIDKQFDQFRDKLQELQFYGFPDDWEAEPCASSFFSILNAFSVNTIISCLVMLFLCDTVETKS
jgi:hypothetical protein